MLCLHSLFFHMEPHVQLLSLSRRKAYRSLSRRMLSSVPCRIHTVFSGEKGEKVAAARIGRSGALGERRCPMPLYVSLLKYSPEGMKGISPERFQRNQALIESKGGKLIGSYALMGEWDVLTITDFPDEKSAMSALVAVGKSGVGTTQTMTAMPLEEFVTLAKNA
jgi:uncharacterized protein with GYD domain